MLKKNGTISELVYNKLFPSGSRPGILYGLPKVHKAGVPLRPVILNLVGGNEPGKFHPCIHRTLRNWKTERTHTQCVCVCLDLRRTPETDSPNPWDSIEPRLRTTTLDPSSLLSALMLMLWPSFSSLSFVRSLQVIIWLATPFLSSMIYFLPILTL